MVIRSPHREGGRPDPTEAAGAKKEKTCKTVSCNE